MTKSFGKFTVSDNDPAIGEAYIAQLPNGWELSIIRNPYSYGGQSGLWEAAVFLNGEFHYENPIAKGSVRGWLAEADVEELLEELETFPTVFPGMKRWSWDAIAAMNEAICAGLPGDIFTPKTSEVREEGQLLSAADLKKANRELLDSLHKTAVELQEHEDQIARIEKRLHKLADELGWCAEFDDEMEAHGLRRRPKKFQLRVEMAESGAYGRHISIHLLDVRGVDLDEAKENARRDPAVLALLEMQDSPFHIYAIALL